MFRKWFNHLGTTLYVQLWENRLKVTDSGTGRTFDETPKIKIVTNQKGEKIISAIGTLADNTQEPNSAVINPFSHPRTLLADFTAAEKVLQHAFKTLSGNKYLSPSPAVVIQPMEKVDGGLTQIEHKAFKELALGAGARDAIVYEGEESSPSSINFAKMANEHTATPEAQKSTLPATVVTVLMVTVLLFIVLAG
ncbi:MAG: rod shape-determining protein MreB [Marinobacter sp.]|uniref:rod shape-determining protein MreB n=1 Tax=Marinobacter sp. TaxID=50741 RepID=UPI00299EFAF6|nr:rod shape-determining protein MreB [Marinobacter sp.]MDX1755745.1 rod shape-determining protein MreB [Marinobacter sp.]